MAQADVLAPLEHPASSQQTPGVLLTGIRWLEVGTIRWVFAVDFRVSPLPIILQLQLISD